MKSLHKILAVSILAAAAGSAMAADETIVTDEGVASFSFFKPAAVRAEVGTTGYGGAISWSANPYVGVTLGYNGGDISWSDDLSINGSKYDLDMDNNLTYLNAEIRPWANWFYMAAGVAYIDNDYDIDRRVRGGETFRVNDVEFEAVGDARINGQLSYKNNIAPYVGIGFSPAITNRWGVFGEIGAYYNGNPTVNLTPTGTAVSTDGVIADFADQVEREERNIRNDNEYEWLPVAKLGVSFRF
ncbi:ornithine uptake porin CarO [Acinetobacter lwoffii]|uniref:Ornithine uptake porin CarO n=1 Tax=Acinetobacter lwoffii TaxID=28090 RepID=A0A6N1MTL1_ACILW|nr:ornithine uptake porin CarO [Acinetobacter lwoffii]QKU21087.1 ornithine uptake porin CarO [Acinetobacter lwoffii]